MGDDVETCSPCNRPQIEIDHYGERLLGCIECSSDNDSYCYACPR
jgi:hypothetical protein